MKIIKLLLVSVGLFGVVGCETVPKVDKAAEVDRILTENPDAWIESNLPDVPPRIRDIKAAKYPKELESAGVRGSVVVQFDVTKAGTTTNLKIMRSDHPLFSEAVLEAARHWIFYPATVKGKPVNVRRVQMPMNFDIN